MDPFNENKAEDCFMAWVITNKDEFGEYLEELRSYGGKYPPFVFKSADKFILRGLEHFQKEGVDKPATEFNRCCQVCKEKLDLWKKGNPFIDIIAERMKEDMELLEQFRNPAYKSLAAPILKERGFL